MRFFGLARPQTNAKHWPGTLNTFIKLREGGTVFCINMAVDYISAGWARAVGSFESVRFRILKPPRCEANRSDEGRRSALQITLRAVHKCCPLFSYY